MRFLKNCWYLSAFDWELSNRLLARKIAGERLVMWRGEDGVPVALHDACPHRLVPLSKGRLLGSQVECWYHGLRFDGSGRCTRIPSQVEVPRTAAVRGYPLVERHGCIWVWTGDANLADPARIPDFYYHKHPEWAEMGHGYVPIAAHAQLAVDNLLDLSHLYFVHARTVGNERSSAAEVRNRVDGDHVTVERWIWDSPPVPLWRDAFGYSGNVDHWLIMHWQPPGFVFMDVGVTPSGRPREEGITSLTSHVITPGAERETHYFWCSMRKPHWGNRVIDRNFADAVNFTFFEDQAIIQEQQKLLDELHVDDLDPGYSFPLNVASDYGPIQARRVMQRLLDAESATASPTRLRAGQTTG